MRDYQRGTLRRTGNAEQDDTPLTGRYLCNSLIAANSVLN